MEIKDWAFLAIGCAQVVLAVLAYRQGSRAALEKNPAKQPRRLLALIMGCMILTWAAVAVDYLNRPVIPPAAFLLYGTGSEPGQFRAQVQFTRWEEFKGEKAMLITHVQYADRDRMTDDWIAKSITYTIDGPQLGLLAVTHNEMRFAGGVPNAIEYDLVILPASIRPEQIKTLSNVPQLGGKILTTTVQTVPGPPLV